MGLNEAAVADKDVLHHRKAEAGALPCRLSGEESIKDVGQRLGGHAAAGIRHPHPHKAAGDGGVIVGRQGVGGDLLRLHGQGAALALHGLHSVGAEVEQHLMQLGGAAVDGGVDILIPFFEPDVGGQDHRDHLGVILQNGFQIHGAVGGRVCLAAAEGQQLLHDLFRAGARLVDLAHVIVVFALGPHPLPDELRVAQNGREQVVELMHDAARQRADGLKFLVVVHLLAALVQLFQGVVDVLEVGGFQLQILLVFAHGVKADDAHAQHKKDGGHQHTKLAHIAVDEVFDGGVGQHGRDVPGRVVDVHAGKCRDLILGRGDAIGVIAVNGRALLLAVLPCEQLVQTLVLRQSVQLLDLPERIERQQLRVGVHDDGAFFVFDDDVSRVLDVQGRKIFLVHLFEVDDDHHGAQRLAAVNDVVHQH